MSQKNMGDDVVDLLSLSDVRDAAEVVRAAARVLGNAMVRSPQGFLSAEEAMDIEAAERVAGDLARRAGEELGKRGWGVPPIPPTTDVVGLLGGTK